MPRRTDKLDHENDSFPPRAPKRKRGSRSEVDCPECGSYEIEEASVPDVHGFVSYCCIACGHYFVAKAPLLEEE